jgi:hypothetical protein
MDPSQADPPAIAALARQPRHMIRTPMRRPIDMPSRLAVLLVCAATLIGLVYAEGWTWPLRVAAVMIPVSYLIG